MDALHVYFSTRIACIKTTKMKQQVVIWVAGDANADFFGHVPRLGLLSHVIRHFKRDEGTDCSRVNSQELVEYVQTIRGVFIKVNLFRLSMVIGTGCGWHESHPLDHVNSWVMKEWNGMVQDIHMTLGDGPWYIFFVDICHRTSFSGRIKNGFSLGTYNTKLKRHYT